MFGKQASETSRAEVDNACGPLRQARETDASHAEKIVQADGSEDLI